MKHNNNSDIKTFGINNIFSNICQTCLITYFLSSVLFIETLFLTANSQSKLYAVEGVTCSDGSLDRSLVVDPLSYFSFQLVLHDWCYPVCGMMHIKNPCC